MKRQVIQLPAQQDEANFKVELLIGQTLEVDCNQHNFFQRLLFLGFAGESTGAGARSGDEGDGKFRCVFHCHSFLLKRSWKD